MCQYYLGFNRCIQVLLDALAIENMPTFRLDGVLRHIVAQSAHRGLAFVAEYFLTADHEIGMARHLAHARDQAEDIGVVCIVPV